MESATNRISEKILEDAREKAKIIVEEAKKASKLMVEKRKQSARYSAEKDAIPILKRSENEVDIIRGKITTDIKRQASWMVLSEKDLQITRVLKEVKNKLINLQKSEKYLPVLENLIVNAGIVLGGRKLKIILNENDSKLPVKLDKLEKKIADETGAKTELIISKKQTKAVGVIVKTNDEKIFVDNTFEAILRRRERELRLKVARILFSTSSVS